MTEHEQQSLSNPFKLPYRRPVRSGMSGLGGVGRDDPFGLGVWWPVEGDLLVMTS